MIRPGCLIARISSESAAQYGSEHFDLFLLVYERYRFVYAFSPEEFIYIRLLNVKYDMRDPYHCEFSFRFIHLYNERNAKSVEIRFTILFIFFLYIIPLRAKALYGNISSEMPVSEKGVPGDRKLPGHPSATGYRSPVQSPIAKSGYPGRPHTPGIPRYKQVLSHQYRRANKTQSTSFARITATWPRVALPEGSSNPTKSTLNLSANLSIIRFTCSWVRVSLGPNLPSP